MDPVRHPGRVPGIVLVVLATLSIAVVGCDLLGQNDPTGSPSVTATTQPTNTAAASTTDPSRTGEPGPTGGDGPTVAPSGPVETSSPTVEPTATARPTAAPVSPGPSTEPTARPTPVDPVPVRVGLEPILSGFDRPIGLFHARDERLFVVEQKGVIHVAQKEGDGWGEPTVFLNMGNRVTCCGERGLLGLAFHPDYEENGLFYITYSGRPHKFVLEERRVSANDPNVAERRYRRVILSLPKPHDYHWGGGIQFGSDGYLWLGMGDGGHLGGTNAIGDPDNHAQDLNSLFGKMLRIDVADPDGDGPARYGIPPDNPYVGRNGADEIWARGLRNPWRWSFDRQTGDLWLPDTGHSRWEEVNRVKAPNLGKGGNFGWRLMEGPACYRPATNCDPDRKTIRPITSYPHPYGAAEFDCAVTGGSVYRGELYPALRGRYFFGDYCTGRIWSIEAEGDARQDRQQMINTDHVISSMGEDVAGEIYITDIATGSVLRLTGTPR